MRNILMILVLLNSFPARGQVSTMLDGSGSQYCDTARWRQVSGMLTDTVFLAQPDSLMCEATFSKEGIFLFELKCANPFGEARDTVRITVIRTILALDTTKYRPIRVRNCN